MISVTTNKQSRRSEHTLERTVYNFERKTENEFLLAVDRDNSPNSSAGNYFVTFVEDRLELRGGQEKWDITMEPNGAEMSFLVMPPNDGFRSPGARPPVSRVDLSAAVPPQEARRMALQVASAVIGIPFLETMLALPATEAPV